VEAVNRAESLAPLAEGILSRWMGEALKEHNPVRWEQIRATILATTPAGFVALARVMQEFDFTNDLPGIMLPSMVICGSRDEAVPPAQSREIARLLRNASYQEIEGARHLCNIDQPERFNELLLEWLRKVDK
jgi:pimeloyl-ACP methyl ester carboxylesterase